MKKYFKERKYDGAKLQVNNVDCLCQLLKIKKTKATNAISMFYGLEVVERNYIPPTKAHLVDKTGTVIKIFNLIDNATQQ